MKGRTNIELREQLSELHCTDPKSKSIFNVDGTISSIGPITKVVNFNLFLSDLFFIEFLFIQIKEKTELSVPMNPHDQIRFNSTSDYSFSDHADSSGAKSRPRSRLTICKCFIN